MKDANRAVERAAMNQVLPPELFSGLLAISADAVIAVDDEQRIVFFNEGAERIFNVPVVAALPDLKPLPAK